MKIMQGDQYGIPIKIKSKGAIITPENCTDVRVKVRDRLISYNDGHGDLIYNDVEQTWVFPLAQDFTAKIDNAVEVQVSVKIGDQIVQSQVQQIQIGRSIITERWNNE